MSTTDLRAADPFSIALTPADIRTCAFPDGNFGWGVLVTPTSDGRWHLTPAPEPEERKRHRAARDEKIGRRRAKGKSAIDMVLNAAKAAGLTVIEAPVPSADTPAEVTLDEVVLSAHPIAGRWRVEGYWNLAGAWRVRGTDDWPFGVARPLEGPDVPVPAADAAAWTPPLHVCLPGGKICVPHIPTFAEAEAYIVAQKLQAPSWGCNCGQVHAEGGEVVGLHVERYDFPDRGIQRDERLMRNVRLIVREDGHQRFRECLPEEVLDLRLCALLDHVGVGGEKPSVWNRKHGDAAARAQEDVFDRMRAESEAHNAEQMRKLRGPRGEA